MYIVLYTNYKWSVPYFTPFALQLLPNFPATPILVSDSYHAPRKQDTAGGAVDLKQRESSLPEWLLLRKVVVSKWFTVLNIKAHFHAVWKMIFQLDIAIVFHLNFRLVSIGCAFRKKRMSPTKIRTARTCGIKGETLLLSIKQRIFGGPKIVSFVVKPPPKGWDTTHSLKIGRNSWKGWDQCVGTSLDWTGLSF